METNLTVPRVSSFLTNVHTRGGGQVLPRRTLTVEWLITRVPRNPFEGLGRLTIFVVVVVVVVVAFGAINGYVLTPRFDHGSFMAECEAINQSRESQGYDLVGPSCLELSRMMRRLECGQPEADEAIRRLRDTGDLLIPDIPGAVGRQTRDPFCPIVPPETDDP